MPETPATKSNTTHEPTADSLLKGIGWMVLSGLLFAAVTGTVRHLGSDMNAVQGAFIRYLFGVALVVPVLWRMSAVRRWPRRSGLMLFRGLLHGVGVCLWFFAMARIPVAEVTAIGFAAPLFTVIGAALFLGERPGIRRIIALLFGLAGTLVILRPGFATVELGAIAQLVAAPLFAGSFLVAKKLTETEGTTVIVAHLSVVVTLVLLVPALAVWRTPTVSELTWLFITAALATAGHITLTRALRAAPITSLQPITFLQLVWASALGYLLFDETPDAWTWIGAVIIVSSASYIVHREAVVTRAG